MLERKLLRSILSLANYVSLFQARHTFPSPEEQSQRNLHLRQKVALLDIEESASGSGSGQGSNGSEIRKLRKKVKELEDQLRESEKNRKAVSEENVELQRVIISSAIIVDAD